MTEEATATEAPAPETTLAERIAAAMLEAGEVTKSSHNTEQNYKFASAEAILKAVREPLLRRGVMLFPKLVSATETEITARSGTKGTRVKMDLVYRFTDGRDELVAEWTGEGQDYGDKAYGKAYTNALKTFIRSAWLLPTEHDDPERSSPGERVGNGNGNGQPAWAKPATRARVGELGQALSPLVGRSRAAAIARSVKDSIGNVPDGFVGLAKLIAANQHEALEATSLREAHERELQIQEAQAAKDAAEAEAAAAAQEASGEPEPSESAEDPPTTPEAAALADGPPAPGSVPKPTLEDGESREDLEQRFRDAGCTCPGPLEDDDDNAAHDENCPIQGHGIGF